MTEATWNDEAKTPTIDWRTSASLENVHRGDEDIAKVTSLEGAVRARLELEKDHRDAAVLTPERPLQIDGAVADSFVRGGDRGPRRSVARSTCSLTRSRLRSDHATSERRWLAGRRLALRS